MFSVLPNSQTHIDGLESLIIEYLWRCLSLIDFLKTN